MKPVPQAVPIPPCPATADVPATLADQARGRPRPHPPHPGLAYRPDIDGLRGVAVALVVMYHAFPGWLPSGFIGVDIFFVISGYLITAIIGSGLASSRFRFPDFYSRRIRRIFPALMTMMAALLPLGWFLLLDEEYRQLGRHVAGGATFLSNLILWRESGYFDGPAETKLLLHLWSLAVEEQFYLLWPALFFLGWRFGWKPVPFLGLLWLASFAGNIYLAGRHPGAAFYWPISRFWELLTGALLAVGPATAEPLRHRHRQGLTLAGLILLAAGLLLINRERVFPGGWALMPTLGAALLIAAGPHGAFNRRVLGNRYLVQLGLISYPLYLWHWPALTLPRMLEGHTPDVGTRLLAVAGALLLAWLTYRLIEKPLRFNPGRWVTPALLAGMLLLYGLGIAVKNLPVPSLRPVHGVVRAGAAKCREPDIQRELGRQRCLDRPSLSRHYAAACRREINPGKPFHIVVWGDSHAHAWGSLAAEIAAREGYHLTLVQHNGCPPLAGVRRADNHDPDSPCAATRATRELLGDILRLEPDVVVLAARWNLYAHGWIKNGALQTATHFLTRADEGRADAASSLASLQAGLAETVGRLTAQRARVIVIKNPPGLKGDAADLRREVQVSRAEHLQDSRVIDALLDHRQDIEVMDPARELCRDDCRSEFAGRYLYDDDNHLNYCGVSLFRSELAARLKPD